MNQTANKPIKTLALASLLSLAGTFCFTIAFGRALRLARMSHFSLCCSMLRYAFSAAVK